MTEAPRPPRTLLHPCPCGCGVLLEQTESRCEASRKVRRKTYEAKRPSSSARGYTSRWEATRIGFLKKHPWCEQCEKEDPPRKTDATVIDHVVPHKGDMKKFWDRSNWSPICAQHHNQKTVREDGGFNRVSAASLPQNLDHAVVPVYAVAGPMGSGRSTFVARVAEPHDLVLDLNTILARVSGLPRYEAGREFLPAALRERNAKLAELTKRPPPAPRAWLVIQAPKASDRRFWRERLGARVLVLATPLETCLARIAQDQTRRDTAAHQDWARQWWASYVADAKDEVIDPATWTRPAADSPYA